MNISFQIVNLYKSDSDLYADYNNKQNGTNSNEYFEKSIHKALHVIK